MRSETSYDPAPLENSSSNTDFVGGAGSPTTIHAVGTEGERSSWAGNTCGACD